MTKIYETLVFSKTGPLGRLELRRPHRLNAVDLRAADELLELAKAIAADPALRMVAITGQGRAFSTGIDLKDLGAGRIEARYFEVWERALRLFETMDKLVLCLIHGYALGGGLQLALAADVRVCTPSAQLGLPAVKEGLIPGLGTWRLARYVGQGRAKAMILRGNMIDGIEAQRIGLVDHLVEETNVATAFEDRLADYAKSNSAGCRHAKALVAESFDSGFEAFFARYLDQQGRALTAPDFSEAMAAYRGNRAPDWG